VKTKAAFYKYLHDVKKARECKFRKDWDNQLQKLASRRDLEKKKRKQELDTSEGRDEPMPQEIEDFAADYMHGCFNVETLETHD